MVCSECTLFHPEYAVACARCGRPLRSAIVRVYECALENLTLAIGMASGAALLFCLSVALVAPSAASAILNVGAYFGMISIGNVWLSVYRGDGEESLRGMRGLGYSAALLFSLVSELARLQHLQALSLPALPGLPAVVPVPSPFVAEMLAAILIVVDPLVVKPVIRWIEDGVERGDHSA